MEYVLDLLITQLRSERCLSWMLRDSMKGNGFDMSPLEHDAMSLRVSQAKRRIEQLEHVLAILNVEISNAKRSKKASVKRKHK